MPLDQDPTWGKFLGAATLIKYLGLICVFYALLYIAARRSSPPFLKTVQARVFFFFFVLTSFSYWFWGPTFSIRSSPFISYLSMAFLFFVVLSTVDSLKRLRWILLAAVGGMGWASLIVVREWMKDPMWRPGSIAGDANYFAMNACLVLPVAFLLMWRSRIRWERIFAVGCLVAIVGASMLGGSRGGFLAVGIAFLWLIWHSPHRIRNLVVVSILLIPPLFFFPFSPVRRLIEPKQSDLNGEMYREMAWKAGLRMVKEHPLAGIGLGEFKNEMVKYNDPGDTFASIAHNTYLEVAAETGIPTLLAFIAMLFFTYRNLGRVRRLSANTGPPMLYVAATGLQAGFTGFFVGAFFLSAEYLKLFWLWVFLSMVLPSLLAAHAKGGDKARKTARKATEQSPQEVGAVPSFLVSGSMPSGDVFVDGNELRCP